MRFSAVPIAVLLLAAPACAGVLDNDNYSIMKPEPNFPGVVNRYKSPRGLKQHVKTPKPQPEEVRRIPQMPPPVISPKTGQALPNLPPPVPGAGIGGRETGQDRAMRCVHQSGVYNQPPGSNYVSTCINQ